MSFVTNVTCARVVYRKFLSFFNTEGVFVCQHHTRASDNSDSQRPIKISTDAPLRESHPLERRNASRVPATDWGWKNLKLCAGANLYEWCSCVLGFASHVARKRCCIQITHCFLRHEERAKIFRAEQHRFSVCVCSVHTVLMQWRVSTKSSDCHVFEVYQVFVLHAQNSGLPLTIVDKASAFIRNADVSPCIVVINRMRKCGRDSSQKQNQITHNKLPYHCEPNDLGTSGNPMQTGSSHDKLVLATAPSQGGSGQFTPCNVATLKSKYAIINSILRDQVDRSEA